MEYDPTAYDLIHFMKVDAPCLSFDILTDPLGYERRRVRELALFSLLPSLSTPLTIPETQRIEISDPSTFSALCPPFPLPVDF